MYNLLIVDDEKIIRDGLFELFSMDERLELNLFTAASAIEAEKILEQRKMDIILTDIQMPKMTGIELLDSIMERWPYAKVIFLTGFSEFDYVYKVHKHAKYVLKAEEDEKIIQTVMETIDEIENDFMIETIVENTNQLQKQQKAFERADFLKDLINGFVNVSGLSQSLFVDLEIPLELSMDMYYIVMRHDSVIRDSYKEQLTISEAMQLMIEKYYFDYMDGVMVCFSKKYILLILQPTKLITSERNAIALKASSELFQKACQKNFGISVAIAIGGMPLPLKDILKSYQTVKAKLLMGSDEQLQMIDQMPDLEQLDGVREEYDKNLIKSRLELLDYYFENFDKEHVIALIREAQDLFGNTTSMHDLFAVEVYSDIAVKLIKYINQFKLSQEICFKINVYNLYNVTLHEKWQKAFDYLIEITEFLFELKKASMEKQKGDAVLEVKRYIQENLDKDTSLDVLADLVGLSPEYLLRLFKKSENQTVLHYINELKIIKAKSLMADRSLQVKEIASVLGFTSSGYFGRFFKSKTGLSPQGYRDQLE